VLQAFEFFFTDDAYYLLLCSLSVAISLQAKHMKKFGKVIDYVP
jgi:hypothetical protein